MKQELRIGFIGLGLIGGSIAKSIKRFHPEIRIYAYTRTEATLDAAIADGIVDVKCQKQDPAFFQCNYIFLCAPVNDNISYLEWLKDSIPSDCIITDVGSVKGEIHEAVRQLGLEANFIGGHPMAGSEKTGYKNSTDFLLENAYYLLTDGDAIEPSILADFKELIASLGAIPLCISSEEHDFITGAVSHLPHIIASTLVNTVKELDTPDEHMKLIAAGGFKDITRIASSSPVMWQQICAENKDMILKVLDSYINNIKQARDWVAEESSDSIYDMFQNARIYRNSVPDHAKGAVTRIYLIYCDIYDEPGGIATISFLLGMSGINIKNISIVNNREFEEGVLRIELSDEKDYKKAKDVLTARNYKFKCLH